jgi:phosphatidate phosphatase APP1
LVPDRKSLRFRFSTFLIALNILCGAQHILAAAEPYLNRAHSPRFVIISDVDDTIKQTGVAVGRTHIRNTPWILLDPIKPWRPVPQMAIFFQRLQHWFNAKFVYVSKGPAFSENRLRRALQRYGFPGGTIVLNSNFPFSVRGYKIEVITPLIVGSPRTHFLLIGDSGEHDPEDYGMLARQFPKQVDHIYIRSVTDDCEARYQFAFRGIPRNRYEIFVSPDDVRDFQATIRMGR